MIPASHPFSISKGATFDKTLTMTISGVPVNFTGYTAEMQLRSIPSATPVVSLTAGVGLTLGSDGTIHIVIAASVTSTLAPGTYQYDLYIQSSGGVKDYILKGTFTVTAVISQ